MNSLNKNTKNWSEYPTCMCPSSILIIKIVVLFLSFVFQTTQKPILKHFDDILKEVLCRETEIFLWCFQWMGFQGTGYQNFDVGKKMRAKPILAIGLEFLLEKG